MKVLVSLKLKAQYHWNYKSLTISEIKDLVSSKLKTLGFLKLKSLLSLKLKAHSL